MTILSCSEMRLGTAWPILIIVFTITPQALSSVVPSGQSCTVTSLIPGTPSPTTTSMSGACQSHLTCRGMGGVPIGKCGIANVCCVFPRTCDARSNQNQTYFTNPGYPSPYNGTLSCTLSIHRAVTPYRLCHIRLDFLDFELNRPTDGECLQDRFIVSGQNSNSVVPSICGRNNGQHIYMDIDGAQGPFTLRVITSGPGYRRWNIQVSQIECANPSKPPANCLQYHTGPSGEFTSFNYESGRVGDLTPMQLGLNPNANLNYPRDAQYFNSMDYAICFRKEIGFCTQTYAVNTTYTPMEIDAKALTGSANFDTARYGGLGLLKCAADYLLLDGIRYCGIHLNSMSSVTQTGSETDMPVIDRGNGPFIARFVSNERYVGRGFRIAFQQNPCGSRIPGAITNYEQISSNG